MTTLPEPQMQLLPSSETVLGEGMHIRRALPTRGRRMVGPWVFLDHFGPVDVARTRGLRVGPHPHIGLQTVTWLYDGEILHRDSLGSLQGILPGQLNLMTAGSGIAHSEESPQPHPPHLHGLQFWIALPDAARALPAAFDHYPAVPRLDRDGMEISLMVGEALGQRSPATMHAPVVGLDVCLPGAVAAELPLRADFEHAVLVTAGEVAVEAQMLAPATLLYLGAGRSRLGLRASAAARFALIGGAPWPQPALLWWNFVARTQQELTQACEDWNAGRGDFGQVHGYDGARLPAPLPPWSSGV